MSKFWDHFKQYRASQPAAQGPTFSEAVDDVRHKVVEEGWFGKKTTGDIAHAAAQDPVGGNAVHNDRSTTTNTVDFSTNNTTTHNHHTLYQSIWGQEPQAKDLYGNAPAAAPKTQSTQEPGLEPGY